MGKEKEGWINSAQPFDVDPDVDRRTERSNLALGPQAEVAASLRTRTRTQRSGTRTRYRPSAFNLAGSLGRPRTLRYLSPKRKKTRIYPYRERKIRSIKKEPKLYLVDWSEVPDPAARFENRVASHLLKFVQYLYEYEGYRADLTFLRNVDKKEVDFLVTIDNQPLDPRIIK